MAFLLLGCDTRPDPQAPADSGPVASRPLRWPAARRPAPYTVTCPHCGHRFGTASEGDPSAKAYILTCAACEQRFSARRPAR